jgi:hypothetical protein
VGHKTPFREDIPLNKQALETLVCKWISGEQIGLEPWMDGFPLKASWNLPLRNTRKIQVDLYISIRGKKCKGNY